MNYTNVFYWLTVADNAKSFFIAFIVIFTIIAVISTIFYIFVISDNASSDEKEEKEYYKNYARKWIFWSYPFMILFWALNIFTPNKKDALLIIGGGQVVNFLTTDSTTRQIPHELTTFIVSELKSMANDAKLELKSGETKDRILEEAKNMSGEELIEKMKENPELKEILIGESINK